MQRPDRKDLLAYLSGETAVSTSIDKSAPIELPKSVSQLNKESSTSWNHHHQQHGTSSGTSSSLLSSSSTSLLQSSSSALGPSSTLSSFGSGGLNSGSSSTASAHHHHMMRDDDGLIIPNKFARLDEVEKVRKQFAARLDAPKKSSLMSSSSEKSVTFASSNVLIGRAGTPGSSGAAGIDGHGSSGSSTLRDALSSDQIAALKAKRLAKKRSTIIDADTDMDAIPGAG